jgi:hypothetical protein
MASLVSEHEIVDNNSNKVIALQQGSMVRKKDFLTSTVPKCEIITNGVGLRITASTYDACSDTKVIISI